MTKSELIEAITRKQHHLPAKDVELAVKHMLELMSETLANGGRIEIRGFGRVSLMSSSMCFTASSTSLAGKWCCFLVIASINSDFVIVTYQALKLYV
jgi:hypothetical protein